MTKIFGYIALVLNTIYKIPQISKLYRTRQPLGISLKSLLLGVLTSVFFIIHGFIIKDLPLLLTGSTVLVQNAILVYLYDKCKTTNVKMELKNMHLSSLL